MLQISLRSCPASTKYGTDSSVCLKLSRMTGNESRDEQNNGADGRKRRKLTIEHEAVPPRALERLGEELAEPSGVARLFPTVDERGVDEAVESRVRRVEALVQRLCVGDLGEPGFVGRHLLDLQKPRWLSYWIIQIQDPQARKKNRPDVFEHDLAEPRGDLARIAVELRDEVLKVVHERLRDRNNLLNVGE